MSGKNLVRQAFWGKEFLSRGLNVTDNAIMVDVFDMVEAENIMVGATWARRKRPGIAYWNTDGDDATANYPDNPKNTGGVGGDPIRGIHEFWRDESGVISGDIVLRQGTKFWTIDSRTSVAVDRTGGLTLQNTGRVTFQPFYSEVFWTSTNPNEGMHKWDGTAATAVTVTGPEGGLTPKFIFMYRNRLIAGGVPGFEYTAYFSELGDGSVWEASPVGTGDKSGGATATAATSLLLDLVGDPSGLTGGVTFQGRAYLFLRRAIYEISGVNATDFRVDPVSVGLGAINHHCILPIGNDVYYLSERGLLSLRSTDKAMQAEYGFMSRDVSRLYHEMLDKSREDQWAMAYDERENLLFITCTTTGSVINDLLLVYNTEKQLWTTWKGVAARSMCKVLVDQSARVLIGREDGIVGLMGEPERLDFATDAIQAQFLSGIYYPSKEADTEHIFKEITLLCSAKESASITLQYSIDSEIIETKIIGLNTAGDTLGSTFTLGSSVLSKGVFTPNTVQVQGRGFGIQVRVIYNADADVEVYGFIIGSVPANNNRVK